MVVAPTTGVAMWKPSVQMLKIMAHSPYRAYSSFEKKSKSHVSKLSVRFNSKDGLQVEILIDNNARINLTDVEETR